MPPTASAYTGQWVNSALSPDSVSVSVAALMNAASSAHTIAAAAAYRAARRVGDPQRAASAMIAAAPPHTASADIQACAVGVGVPPCGSSIATNAASPAH